MTNETISAITIIKAPAETVFGILADPARHAAIDGTGWVGEPVDGEHLNGVGQIFRMAMYHARHPNGSYEMANKVREFDRPRAISWEPGQDVKGDGKLEFGGWIWRYDLTAINESETEVELSYDWSAVPQEVRKHIEFPPFPLAHLQSSLDNLAELAGATR